MNSESFLLIKFMNDQKKELNYELNKTLSLKQIDVDDTLFPLNSHNYHLKSLKKLEELEIQKQLKAQTNKMKVKNNKQKVLDDCASIFSLYFNKIERALSFETKIDEICEKLKFLFPNSSHTKLENDRLLFFVTNEIFFEIKTKNLESFENIFDKFQFFKFLKTKNDNFKSLVDFLNFADKNYLINCCMNIELFYKKTKICELGNAGSDEKSIFDFLIKMHKFMLKFIVPTFQESSLSGRLEVLKNIFLKFSFKSKEGISKDMDDGFFQLLENENAVFLEKYLHNFLFKDGIIHFINKIESEGTAEVDNRSNNFVCCLKGSTILYLKLINGEYSFISNKGMIDYLFL